ncbi:MAG TPA: prolyl oligopeptidase family serine peptidase [Puia sp.]|nr:prolyl oligopeptidase family serine peptidase [Puia sp.]
MRKPFFSRVILLLIVLLPTLVSFGQKKPLDPSVYDHWESIGEKLLSPDGKYLVYTIVPQEGDGRLIIRATANDYAKEIPRGAVASITADSRWLVFHIKPFYKDIRDARIHKKTPEASPKDTLAWIRLGTDILTKVPRVKSFRVPEKEGAWLAYLLEKPAGDSTAKKQSDSTAEKQPARGGRRGGGARPAETTEEGTDLVLRNLEAGNETRFALASEYQLSKKGNTLIIETTSRNGDSTSKALVLWINTSNSKVDTVLRQFHDARNYALDEAGGQLAFVAERDSATKALVKFYRLWYYTPGMDSAVMRADRNIINTAVAAGMGSNTGAGGSGSHGGGFHFPPMPLYVSSGAGRDKAGRSEQMTVSPDFVNYFSKDGDRLFLGLAPIRPPKDTNLVDFETARLDVWTYKDDYLSPQQLVQLNGELKRSYLAVLPAKGGGLTPLADGSCESVIPSREGDGRWALGMSSKNYRIQQQWEQSNLQDIYLIDLLDGSRRLVQEKVRGEASFSPEGKFIFWYDWKGRNWYTYEIASGRTRNITTGIKVPLYDELDDHPDDPPPHGTMGWQEGDRFVYLYDRYDIWQCDPAGAAAPVNLTRGYGRRHKLTFRHVDLGEDTRSRREERDFGSDDPIRADQLVLFRLFDRTDMSAGLRLYRMGTNFDTGRTAMGAVSYSGFTKAKNNWSLAYLKGSYDKSNDIYSTGPIDTNSVADLEKARPFSHINPQQAGYNWLTVELHHWKMFDGKMSEGLLYKPENFDSTKKYPIIFYFYERDAETRYQYIAPQPVRASINVPYFVSNGYLVFDPDIFYKTGQPGEDAYNSVISAVRYLSRFKWVDTTKIGIQGHSWGGYQVAYLITRTNLFAAAEAGAPVANMTSAYGGIRWSAGISRQFQYERSQSRIGSTLWQRPDLYIKNSPLFRADKITTPLLMMHNDADGAVPWYQGIEYFSALRRLGKKVWLMQYNGEDHGLGERRNRKDWSMRLSQYFGYYLKGEEPARWITDGVPATLKGIDWGLELE